MTKPDPTDFTEKWASENVHNIPGLENPEHEVKRLKEKLLADAKAVGLSQDEIESEMGDLDDYLGLMYQNVFDPTSGFFESR